MIDTFIEQESEVGVFYTCNKCRSLCSSEEREAHRCPKSSEEMVREQNEKYEEGLIESMGDERLYLKDRIQAANRFMASRDLQFEEAIRWLEDQYPVTRVRALVTVVLRDRLGAVKRAAERHYGAYEELRRQGMPYQERRGRLNRAFLSFCEAEESRILSLSRAFKVRSWREFLRFGDLVWIKHLGIKGFISLFLEEVLW